MKSDLCFPNRFARITLESMEEVIGASGMKAILNMAALHDLATELPPDDMERQFDFADFSQLISTLTVLFGVKGAKPLAARAGRVTLIKGMKSFNENTDIIEHAGPQPSDESIMVHLNRFSNFLNSVSDLVTTVYARTEQDGFEFVIEQCPVCWGQKTCEPVCSFFVGMFEEAIRIFSNGQPYSVSEAKCLAYGDECCLFILQKVEPAQPEVETEVQEPS